MEGSPGSDRDLRLLLDEHISPAVAVELRRRGHDVIAVAEHVELRGRADIVHFAASLGERRAIVTRDLGDFRPLVAVALRDGAPTAGVVCISRRLRLSRDGIGELVKALDLLLQSNPDDEAVLGLGGELWLEPA